MAMIPENPVVGGTMLRRAAIQSPNFVTGSAGWTINQDGSAEFNNLVIRNGQIVSGTALYYSGTPAAGNLIASIAAAAGTDSFGNHYLQDFGAYNTLLGIATMVNGGGITFFSGNLAAGWSSVCTINFDTGTQAAKIGSTGLEVIGGLTADTATVSGALSAAGASISGSTGAFGGLLSLINTLAAPGSAPIHFQAQGGTDRFIAMDVAGDTVRRWTLNPSGLMLWGPGNAAQDSTLFRAAANLLASDYLAYAATATTAETWHAFTFVNGWAQAIGPTCSYRRVAAPDNCVQLMCALIVPAGVVAGQNITGAMPTGYRPISTQWVNATNGTGPKSCIVTVTTGGQLQFQSGAVAGDEIIIPAGNLVALTV